MSGVDRGLRLTRDDADSEFTSGLEGLILAGAPLLRKTATGWEPRSEREIQALIEAAYGNRLNPTRLRPGLDVIAQALNAGDLGRAMVAAIHLRLPSLSAEDAERLAGAEIVLAKYDPSEPRDQRGRWTARAGGVAGAAVKPREKPAETHRKPSRRVTRFVAARPAAHATAGAATGEKADRSVGALKGVAFEKSPLNLAEQKRVSAAVALALEGGGAELLAWLAMERALGMGDEKNPGPGRLLYEWRTGSGPQTRVLGPNSDFSQQFAVAPSTQDSVQAALLYWSRRAGGFAGQDRSYSLSDYKRPFGRKEFIQDTAALNAAAHVIGSFNLAGIMDGDTIHWRAINDMGLHSFAAGRLSDKLKLPSLMQNVDRPLPFGTTRQTILWDTDLSGRYRRH